MSAKVVRKIDPMEKVGVLAHVDGRIGIVEYTEIDDEHRNERDAAGELVYWAGSIAIHVLEVAFARKVAANANALLPFHASAKKVPYLDEAGRLVKPAQPNAHKLERFLFDAIRVAERVALLEVRRADEYAPVKNAEGQDSAHTARGALDALVRRWLAIAQIDVPADVWAEVDHSKVDGEDDVRACVRRPEDAGLVTASRTH
jgi:UDP-N-acetylglucosamine/UDP-N-acetylgalactosamine diphosphorylase